MTVSPPPPLRPTVAALANSLIAETSAYGRDRAGLIALWYGEGDIPAPDFIGAAAAAAIRDGHVFYTPTRGLPALRATLAAYESRLHGRAIEDSRITVTASGMSALMVTLQALIDPGDAAVIPSPLWPNVAAAVGVLGGEAVEVPLGLGAGRWSLDLDRLFAACGPRARVLILNSPGNPTGWMLEPEEIERILAFARRRGLWVLADEVYGRLTYDRPRAPSFLDHADPEDRLVVVNSFSKSWAMTGWRLGWAVAPAALGPVYDKLIQFNYSGAPGFIQMAGLRAVEDGEPFVAEMIARCRRGRDIACGALEAMPKVRLAGRPEGAFYAFFAVAGEPDSTALARRLIDGAAVGLAPGAAFGVGGEGWLLLCFASSPDRLALAMDRLAEALR